MMVDFTKKDRFTPQERMRRLIVGEPIDRVPFNPFASAFIAKVCGIDRGTFYRNPEVAFEAGLRFMKAYPWMNARPSYGWADQGAWEFGGGIVWPDNDEYPAPRSFGPVITDPSEVDCLPDPDPKTAGMMPLVHRFNAISRENGFPASLPGGSPTSFSAAIAGDANLLRWVVRYPKAVHELQRKVADFLLRTAEMTITNYGAENCGVFCAVPMDSNQLISPKAFERFSKPYIKEILAYYIERGVKSFVVHLCGDHTGNLVHWGDIPLPPRTTFSIGHEMDLEATGQFIGESHILAGNISTPLLQTGSYEDVYTETVRCLKTGMRHPGGYILMPACAIPPNTPIKNVEAVAHALFEHGYY
jgi:uroporphyrinogen decarboxylase